jgi:predicted porin
MWGVFDKFEYGAATLRIAYQQRKASSKSLLTGISGAWITNSDLSVGAGYDTGDWFILSEWIQRKSTTKLSAMYVSGGYRLDQFTPYATYSNNGKGSFLPGYPAPTAASIRSTSRSQSTTSLGIRWDFMKNTDLKVQYDRVQNGNDTNGYIANVPAGVILNGTSYHVISAVVDFIF